MDCICIVDCICIMDCICIADCTCSVDCTVDGVMGHLRIFPLFYRLVKNKFTSINTLQ